MAKWFIIPIITLFTFAACGNKVFDKYAHTPVKGWEKNDTLSFNVPKMRESAQYGVDLGLRINRLYPFMQLTLIIEQKIYPSNETRIDTLNCKLIDKNGYPKGQGISYYQYNYHIADRHLNSGDSLYITVRHDMKREILPGISDVGIQVNKE